MIEAADTEGQGGAAFPTGEPIVAARRRRRHWRVVAWISVSAAVAAVAVFAGGFLLFLSDIAHYRAAPAARHADGIVVLTGGYARIDEAVRLLNNNMGERLLISGVHPSASRKVLARTFAVDKDRFACCVDIDREALDTAGNAAGTARWAAEHGFSSLIVVTNDYHMPRSLLEFRRAMGGVELIPHAVVTGSHASASAEEQANRYRVLLGEYVKYGAARVRNLVAPGSGPGAAIREAELAPTGN